MIKHGASIGANATIICGNVIGAYSMVAAGAVVTQDVAPFSLVMGNPARIIGMVCKKGHRMKQVNKIDEKEILTFLNQEEEIAFIISNGENNWKAVNTINEFPESEIAIWHIPSGKLPLLTPDESEEWITEPFNGWIEKRKSANGRTPYFGAGWPGIIHLNIRTNNEREIEMSSLEWIGNHYSIIGISASEVTKKFWNRLRRQIKKRAIQIPRSEQERFKPEIFTFKSALSEIKKGKERNLNP